MSGDRVTVRGRQWRAGRFIRDRLVGDAACRALVGERVYPVVAPEGATLPLCTYRMSSTDRRGSHMLGHNGVVTRSYYVEVHGEDYDEIDAFAAEFVASLESWRGVEGSLRVRRVDVTDESDEQYDRPETGEDSPIFMRLFEITVHLTEDATTLPDGSYGG